MRVSGLEAGEEFAHAGSIYRVVFAWPSMVVRPTGETLHRVVDTFVNTAAELTTLEVRDGEHAWTITGTPEHPFYISSLGAWSEMSQLAAGDVLASPEGEIEVVSVSTVPASQTVYNFEVEDAHTYYVGSADVEGGSVLVHNNCWRSLPGPAATGSRELVGAHVDTPWSRTQD
jgi:hypothetical protein